MNGVSGAISRVTVSTTSCSVRSAALSPCQKRRRERRTYQLDRSSTNADSSLPARWVSYASSACVDLVDQRVEFAQQPAVQDRALGRGRVGRGRRPVGRTGVQGLEGDRVPVRQERLADDLLDRAVAHPAGRPRRTAGRHEPAHRVRAVLVHQRDRLEDVAQVLGHLAAVLGEDVAEADDVLVRRLVEDQRADRHQRVEPAAGLVDGLAR